MTESTLKKKYSNENAEKYVKNTRKKRSDDLRRWFSDEKVNTPGDVYVIFVPTKSTDGSIDTEWCGPIQVFISRALTLLNYASYPT